VAQAFENPDGAFGKPAGAIFGKFAVGGAPPGSTRLNLPLLLRAISRVLGWRLRGRSWPHPFFARDTGVPLFSVSVIERDRREALRRLCGPAPSVPAGAQAPQ